METLVLPVYFYLDHFAARPAIAFDAALRKARNGDRRDPVCEIDARKVMITSGASNAMAIAETSYKELNLGSSSLNT